MRVRRLDENGDDTFGSGVLNFIIDKPEGVAQCISTRLKLKTKEWFLDLTSGTNYDGSILGYKSAAARDAEIKERIAGTLGFTEFLSFNAVVTNRHYTVSARVLTQYSANPIAIEENVL